jgi:ABC-type transport system involved in cytochrome bd biosynthesis fused ATPase/permease subunit
MKIFKILKQNYPLLILLALGLLLPEIGYCATLEGALNNLQSKFLTVILPTVSIFGLIYSAIEMVSGSASGKAHMLLAIFGAVIGFLAPMIINFLKGGLL